MAVVLVVEDSSFTRKTLCRILEAEGYGTLEAGNGYEGLEKVTLYSPDCILLDLLMPEVNGFEVLEILQAQGSKIPVIAITADIQQSVRQRCFELGAKKFLNKPPNLDEVRKAVKDVLTCQVKS